jgi:ParB family chromosome partitioning protein
MKRKALGRGLRSLIPQSTTPSAVPSPEESPSSPRTPGLLQLDLDRIRPNAEQPRSDFDEEALAELASSLKREGVLQPVIVRPLGEGQYELIAGERRWRAAQLAGLLKIPAIVREIENERRLEVALVENIQREDLNPIEAANAFRTLIDDLQLTQQEVAQRVGKQRATISNMLRLLDLPRPVQEKIRDGSITTGHAKALAAMSSSEMQIRLADRIARQGLSVREVESIVKRMDGAPAAKAARTPDPRDPNVAAAEETLQRALGTKVAITQGKKGGRIELHFFSNDEMQRVYQIVLDAAKSSHK